PRALRREVEHACDAQTYSAVSIPDRELKGAKMAQDRQGAKGARGAPQQGGVALMKVPDFNKYLTNDWAPHIQRVIPTGIALKTDQIIGQAVTAFANSEYLQKCKPITIVNSLVYAAQVGLEICTPRGYAWLIPYGGNCTYQTGFKGFIELGHRSGKIQWPKAEVVYKDDHFINRLTGQGLVFEFEKAVKQPDPETWIGAFVYVTFVSGDKPYVHFMRRDEIEAIRDKSSRSAYGDPKKPGWGKTPDYLTGPWKDWADEMRKKTVIKQGFKNLQLSDAIGMSIGIDDQAIGRGHQEFHPKVVEV